MNIIIIKGHNLGMRTDTEVFVDGLKRLGHIVFEMEYYGGRELFTKFTKEDFKTADIVWCPYERELPIGVRLKEELNIPLVGHYEWVPPWRINSEKGLEWGYAPEEIKTIKFEGGKSYYESLVPFYNKSDLKTTPTKYCFETVKALGAEEKNLRIKPYAVDDELLLSQKDDTIKKENQILTIARLVQPKKIHHIIKALSLIDNPPLLKIIGYGLYQPILKKLSKELDVKILFCGTGIDGNKAIEIQKSLFLVTPAASLPLGEAALFKVPTISYNNETGIEKHGNVGKYVELDNIEELSKAIKFWIDNPEEARKEGENSYNKIMNDETGLCTTENACKKMVKIFEEALCLKK